LTRACKPVTRQFLLLDSDSTRPSHDSTLTRLEQILHDSGSTLTRKACDSDSTKMTRAHHWILITWNIREKVCALHHMIVYGLNINKMYNFDGCEKLH